MAGEARMRSLGLGLMLLALAACTARGPAPVADRVPAQVRTTPPPVAAKPEPERPVTPQIAASTNGMHTVQRGDTLYAIAFANNLDYRDIASWNQLESPDRIMVGQTLRLTPPPGAIEIKPLEEVPPPSAQPLKEPPLLTTPQAVLLAYSDANWARVSGAPKDSDLPRAEARAESNVPAGAATAPPAAKPSPPATPSPASPVASVPAAAAAASAEINWLWPAAGTLAGRFGAAGGKGIDIVGPRNAPVVAVAPGKVVYSGSGLRGYGRLLIVKHAGEYLSAYAHNDSILVKEGDTVTAGQRIALMGDSDADKVMLHFEIRRYGKPLDPLKYLPERS
jgi:lipoprotein NlpD